MATYSNESYQLRLGLLDDDDDEADECVGVDEQLAADCSYDVDADDAAAADDDAGDRGRDDGDGDDDCDCADSGDTRTV